MSETLSDSVPSRVEDLAEDVLKAACKAEFKLVTAESCTGGLLASLLTDVEGSAHAFERGFVVYTNEAKHELLGVPLDILDRPGAVSREVAVAMAEGALAASRGDIALSTTGFAGAGAPGDPPGLVYFGLARRGASTGYRVAHFGDVGRGSVRVKSLEVALEMLRQALAEQAAEGLNGQAAISAGAATP